ncbi:ABC transporter ATP-binding protein [Sulfurimonas sp. HSL-1716]|uniref:ABC transporter ATP-binding protein n=1 Tax=Hydrocurvibacter sulfurireducens TaxID=3131937 RepID=UPI0031FA3C3C
MIEIKQLTCRYSEEVILQEVNLDIGAHLSILGPNGSGKSTLAKALCGLIAYEGQIRLKGIEIKELSFEERAKTIAYIPAKLDIYDHYVNVFEFVLLGRFSYKKSFFDYTRSDKKIAEKNMRLMGIEHLKDHRVSSLSSGETALVLMAQALTQESEIIIFDEPSANLDPHNAKVIANRIKELKRSHQIILITHDLHLASYIDNPVLFIKDKNALYFEKDFFQTENLKRLYGVDFHALAVKYE